MNETMGIELELKTKGFSDKMKEIQKKASSFSDKVKENLNVGFNLKQSDVEKNITEISKKLESAKSKLNQEIKIKVDVENIELKSYEKSIDDLKNRISLAKTELKDMQNYNANPSEIDTLKTYINDLNLELKETTKLFNSIKTTSLNSSNEKIASLEKEVKKLNEYLKDSKKDLETFNANPIARIGATARGVVEVFKVGKGKVSAFNTKMQELSSKLPKIKKQTTGLEETIKKSFSKMKGFVTKFTLSILSVRTAFAAIRKATSSYLSFDSELNDSFTNSWNTLGSLLAPAIELVANLFSYATSTVASFVKVLTGVDLVARANSKALSSQSKSAKDAQKSLSSWHDITNINDNNSNSSSDVQQITVGDVDTSKFQPLIDIIDKIKQKAREMFQPLKEIDFTNLQNSLSTLGESLGTFAGIVWDRLEWAWYNLLIPLANWTIEDVLPAFLNILAGALDVLNQVCIDLQPIWQWFWDNFLSPILTWTGGIIVDILNGIGNGLKWISDNEIAMSILEGIFIAFAAYNGILATFNIIGTIASGVGYALGGAIAFLTSPITLVIIAIGALIGVGILLYKNWDTIKEKASKIFSAIGKFIGNFVDGAKSAIKGMINGIIGWINIWINGLNILLAPLRAIVYGVAKAFGKNITFASVRIPNIPRLKIGTDLVQNEGLAYLHSGEKVVPAAEVKSGGYTSNNSEQTELLKEQNRLLAQLLNKNSNIELDGKNLSKGLYPYFKEEERRRNTSDVVRVR